MTTDMDPATILRGFTAAGWTAPALAAGVSVYTSRPVHPQTIRAIMAGKPGYHGASLAPALDALMGAYPGVVVATRTPPARPHRAPARLARLSPRQRRQRQRGASQPLRSAPTVEAVEAPTSDDDTPDSYSGPTLAQALWQAYMGYLRSVDPARYQDVQRLLGGQLPAAAQLPPPSAPLLRLPAPVAPAMPAYRAPAAPAAPALPAAPAAPPMRASTVTITEIAPATVEAPTAPRRLNAQGLPMPAAQAMLASTMPARPLDATRIYPTCPHARDAGLLTAGVDRMEYRRRRAVWDRAGGCPLARRGACQCSEIGEC